MRLKKTFIGCQQHQAVRSGSCNKESIGWILMGQIDSSTHQHDGMRQRGLPKWGRGQEALNPPRRIRLELKPFSFSQ